MASQEAEGRDAGSPVVEVEFAQPGIAFVRLLGEHDLSTNHHLADALAAASARPSVLVDLSECSFMDSSVIHALTLARERLSARGGRLELVVPLNARFIRRVVAMTTTVHLGLPPIHDTQVAAITGLRTGAHSIEIRDLRARYGNPDARAARCSCGWHGDTHTDPHWAGRNARREGAIHVAQQSGSRSTYTGPEVA